MRTLAKAVAVALVTEHHGSRNGLPFSDVDTTAENLLGPNERGDHGAWRRNAGYVARLEVTLKPDIVVEVSF